MAACWTGAAQDDSIPHRDRPDCPEIEADVSAIWSPRSLSVEHGELGRMIELLGVGVPAEDGGWLLHRVCARWSRQSSR